MQSVSVECTGASQWLRNESFGFPEESSGRTPPCPAMAPWSGEQPVLTPPQEHTLPSVSRTCRPLS